MNKIVKLMSVIGVSGFFIACHANQDSNPEIKVEQGQASPKPNLVQQFSIQKIVQFNEPWALETLSDGKLLITEKSGQLKLFDPETKKTQNVADIPKVAYGGQGGLGDVTIHPNFNNNAWVYLSYAEALDEKYGAVVIRGRLDLTDSTQPKLKEITRIWEQTSKVTGQGHYAHRIVFDRQANLWISSGDRQKFEPAQDMQSNMGKVLALYDDGRPQQTNPFYKQGGVTAQIWSLGHRNPLGMAFDGKNQLWVAEMGPKGGDELNLIQKGQNYGYPLVSNGDHYDGKPIPNHDTRPEFTAPELDWTPVISPSSLIFYQGDEFPQWTNKAIIGGLSSKAIIIVDTETKPVREVQRLDMGVRIRDLHQAQNGDIWGIEDGSNGYLFKIKAKK